MMMQFTRVSLHPTHHWQWDPYGHLTNLSFPSWGCAVSKATAFSNYISLCSLYSCTDWANFHNFWGNIKIEKQRDIMCTFEVGYCPCAWPCSPWLYRNQVGWECGQGPPATYYKRLMNQWELRKMDRYFKTLVNQPAPQNHKIKIDIKFIKIISLGKPWGMQVT